MKEISKKSVENYCKSAWVFRFQSACNFFDLNLYQGGTIKNQRTLLQMYLFELIKENKLSYNNQTGNYKYLGE